MKKIKLLAAILLLICLGFSGCVHEPWVQKETEADQISLAKERIEDYIQQSRLRAKRPQTVFQVGHSGRITAIAVSPDGKWVATGGEDSTVRLWTRDGSLIHVCPLVLSSRSILDIIFTPDSKRFIVNDGLHISVWNINGTMERGFSDYAFSGVSDIALSPDGNKLLAAGSVGETGSHIYHLYELSTGEIREYSPFPPKPVEGSGTGTAERFRTVAFSPDGKTMAFSQGLTVKLYDIDGEQKGNFTLSDESFVDIAQMEFSPDGRYIAFGTGDVRPPFTSEVFPDEASVEKGRKHDTDLYIAAQDGKVISKTTWKNYLCGMAVSCPIWYLQWRGDGESLYAGDAEGIKHLDIQGNILNEFPGRAIGVYEQSGELYTSKENTIVVKNFEGKKIREFRTKSYDSEAPLITQITDMKKPAAEYSAVFDKERIQLKRRGEKESDTIVLRNTEVDKDFEVTDVSIHPEGNLIALGGGITGKSISVSKPLIYILDTEGKVVHQYTDFIKDRYIGMYVEELNTIKFSAGGRKLIGINGISKLLKDELQKTRHSGFILDIETGAKRYFRCSSLSKIVLHPVEAYFAVDMGFGDVCIYDYQGSRIALLQRKERNLVDFFFSENGRYLFTDSGNGVLEVFDLETENVLTAAAFKDGEWFVADGRGRFDCSAGGFENVLFVKGTKLYEPEQFWDSFFTPGLLSRFTGAVPFPEDEIEGEEDKASPVEIAEAAENIPYVTMETGPRQKDVPTAEITVTAEEGANGIGKIFLIHNGRVVDENSRGLDKIREAESVTFTLPLVEGENTVQGGAYDKDGKVYGTSRSAALSYEPAKVIPPDMYVLSVGVGEYHDTGMTLGAPDDDALAIAELFPGMADDLYGEVRTMLFINEEAEKVAVEQALADIIQQVETRDTVIIFFAGHGYVDRDIYYFLPYDTDITDMESTAVDIGTLSAFLRDLPANKVALFLDTCQSGSAVKTLGAVAMSRSIDEKRQIANLAKARGIAVFSASSATQKAYEIPELNHGLFTHSILTALEKRKTEVSIRGKVALGKLLSTVNRLTRDTAYEYLGIEQSPSVYIFGDDFYIGEVE